MLGPFDLAKQMGVERGGEEHEAAIQRILKATKAAGKTAAIFCMSPDLLSTEDEECILTTSLGTDGAQAKQRADQGFDMVSIVTDLAALESGIMAQLKTAKGVTGETGKRDGY